MLYWFFAEYSSNSNKMSVAEDDRENVKKERKKTFIHIHKRRIQEILYNTKKKTWHINRKKISYTD